VIYQFGECRLDAAAYELHHGGRLVKIEPQVLDLLLMLVGNRERIVSRDEIVEQVWQGRAVSDAAVSSRIKSARQLIGDTGKDQEFIRTIHGRGFRFVAPVQAEPGPNGDGHSGQPGHRDRPGPAGQPPNGAETPLASRPVTKYAKSGDVHVACQIFGDGPAQLVLAPGFISQIDNYWDEPHFNRWLTVLGRHARVAMFDKRGTGLSDQVPNLPGMDERMDDLRAAMDLAGFDKAAVMGISEGGSLASLFAATHPERVSGLILYGSFARFTSWFPNDDALQGLFDYVEASWGSGNSVGDFAPSMADDEAFRAWWGKFERLGATPRAVIDLMRMNREIDISEIVPSIAVPTLVVHRAQDTVIDVEAGRFLAANIPGAHYLELPGEDHVPWVGDNAAAIVDAVADFLSILPEQRVTERFLATVLALRPGGDGAASLPELLDGPMRLAVARNGGIMGAPRDGVLTARFNGPARALRAAGELVGLLRLSGRDARAGVHTGEVDLAQASAGGITAAIASDAAARAGPGDVVATRTVKDLVAGSGMEFNPTGAHRLAGMAESWELYNVKGGA
jgi:pimeloyl-ACP methyl ester carboxylesterase